MASYVSYVSELCVVCLDGESDISVILEGLL